MRGGGAGGERKRSPAILPNWVKRVASAEADFYHGRDPDE
jgi:hypothetical protein